MRYEILVALIPLLPLAGFILLGLFGKNFPKQSSGIIATVLMLVSALLSIKVALDYFIDPLAMTVVDPTAGGGYQRLVPLRLEWLQFSKGLSIEIGTLLDPISVMMLVIVTFVSLMVHIYSLSYLKGEERFSTYFSFLGLFSFSMLGLVLSSNLFQIYMFWELVGVSSFLLIGFYYSKPSAVAACKKAFIVTRFADLGFLIGILVLSYYGGSLDFGQLLQVLTSPGSNELKSAVSSSFLGVGALSWALILLFMGAAGKSAMFPLHIWLPDAMEGPTPVSALIHAATMVVAGVYLVARLFPIFAISAPAVLEMISWVGVISAVFAAIIACTQTDIKRVLAFSTMSQIGFMMFALGLSHFDGGGKEIPANLGYTASLFHLFTHALFKALLFLGAGAVIHFIHSNDLKDMGGLRKHMPITHICFLIACLAISGIPPFAGFFSKEEILLAAYENNQAIYWIALCTSALTAFYMFRLYFGIFWTRPFQQTHKFHGEGSWLMLLPLVLLAIGAFGAGFVPFGKFISSDGKPLIMHLHLQFSILPVVLAVGGIAIAYWLYAKENSRPATLAASLGGLYKAAYRKFYIDELYLFITKKILFNLIGRPAAWFDKNIIDGLVNATGNATQSVSGKIKKVQSGKVQDYALWFLSAVIGMAIVVIYLWK